MGPLEGLLGGRRPDLPDLRHTIFTSWRLSVVEALRRPRVERYLEWRIVCETWHKAVH